MKDIAVTLDKVTVHRVSYTVIMTYFFQNGKIHVILNKLQELTSVDYSGMETASMVVAVLKETLGLTDTQLARILRHFVYVGVYLSLTASLRCLLAPL